MSIQDPPPCASRREDVHFAFARTCLGSWYPHSPAVLTRPDPARVTPTAMVSSSRRPRPTRSGLVLVRAAAQAAAERGLAAVIEPAQVPMAGPSTRLNLHPKVQVNGRRDTPSLRGGRA